MRHRAVRHIPEEELHAYLDQALSRSQCIEIETHLARCTACSLSRDDIAGLRDRTTALLAKVAPRRTPAPSFATLEARSRERRRRSWQRPALWAASVAGVLFAGWATRAALAPSTPVSPEAPLVIAQIEPAPAQTDPAPLDPVVLNAEQPATPPAPTPETASSARGPATANEPPVRPPADSESRPGPPGQPPLSAPMVSIALLLDDGWTLATLGEAEEATGGLVPLIPELPVAEVRLRPAGPRERPLILVTQRHPDGADVFTVEGPVAAVAEMVASQLGSDQRVNSSEPSRSPPDYVEAGATFQRTSRVLAVLGQLSADALNALAGSVVLR